MAVYTDLTDDELAELLADFDLGAPLAFKGIAEGVENSNFLLETEAGRFILTVYEKRVRAEDLPFFLGLMRWLAEHGYPSATPVADRSGQLLKQVRGKPCAIVSFLPGLSVRRPSVAHCREAGAGLARLHLAAAGFAGVRPNDLGQAAWAPMFDGLADDAEGLKPGLGAVVAADLAHFERAWPRDLPTGVIHADYFPDNVFFREGRFAGTIDFYFACVDALAYDIAIALNAWCFEPDGSFNITSARAMVAGYEAHRPLSEAERDALPVLEYERKLAVHRAAPDLVLFGSPA
jgi:homoserine kinase type II